VLGRLPVFRDLPWTDGWRALQRAVVAVDVPMRDNPRPRLLTCAQGREPVDLDAAWAPEIDRALRSTLLHPPHGRADLALAFAKNVLRLGRLCDNAGVAGSGLLPARIGTCRPSESLVEPVRRLARSAAARADAA
jgi:hypothetical protein